MGRNRRQPRRNDPCPCGSGRKAKHCCLRRPDQDALSGDDAGARAGIGPSRGDYRGEVPLPELLPATEAQWAAVLERVHDADLPPPADDLDELEEDLDLLFGTAGLPLDDEEEDPQEFAGIDEVDGVPYDADEAPDPQRWLELEADDRLLLIRAYHLRSGHDLRWRRRNLAHAIVHSALEEQLAANDPPEARPVLARLLADGLGRHEALHAMGGAFAEHVHAVVTAAPHEEPEPYAARLLRVDGGPWLAARHA